MLNHTQAEENNPYQITEYIDPSNLPRLQAIIRKVLAQPPSIEAIYDYKQSEVAVKHLPLTYKNNDKARGSQMTDAMIGAYCIQGGHPNKPSEIFYKYRKYNLKPEEAFLIMRSRSFEAFSIGNCAARAGWMFLQFINHEIFSPENIKMINYPDHDHYVLQIKVNHNGENIYMICDPLLNPELLFGINYHKNYILPALATLPASAQKTPTLNLEITRGRAVELYRSLQISATRLRIFCKRMLRESQDEHYLFLLQENYRLLAEYRQTNLGEPTKGEIQAAREFLKEKLETTAAIEINSSSTEFFTRLSCILGMKTEHGIKIEIIKMNSPSQVEISKDWLQVMATLHESTMSEFIEKLKNCAIEYDKTPVDSGRGALFSANALFQGINKAKPHKHLQPTPQPNNQGI